MDMAKVIEDLDLLRDLFIEHSIATEEEIDLVTSINGNNLDAYNDILDVRTGYKSWEQYVGFDEDDCRQILKETLEDGAKSQDKFTSLYDVVTESQVDDFLDHLMEDIDCFNFEDKPNLNEYDLIEEFLEFSVMKAFANVLNVADFSRRKTDAKMITEMRFAMINV